MNINGPFVVKSRLSILYEPVVDIRKKLFEIEESLKEHFLAPNLIPVPDDAPGEIPRIQISSINGHTVARFAQIRADVITDYDKAYNSDQDKCFKYVDDKASILNSTLKIIRPDIATTALAFNVRWPIDVKPGQSIIEELAPYLMPRQLIDEEIEDFRIRKTARLSESYFLITTISNYLLYHSDKPVESPHPSLRDMNIVEQGLEMEIEVNDKLGLNRYGNRSNGLEVIPEFLKILSDKLVLPFDLG